MKSIILLLLLVAINYTGYSQKKYDLMVGNIVANKNGKDTFYIPQDSVKMIVLVSSKLDVQSLMTIAFFREAIIDYDLVQNSTEIIQRVKPFDACVEVPLPFPYQGKYRVSRLATQRNPEGIEHLEVFILSEEDDFNSEMAYNVIESNMKQLLEYIFMNCSKNHPINFNLRFDITGKCIDAIYIGH